MVLDLAGEAGKVREEVVYLLQVGVPVGWDVEKPAREVIWLSSSIAKCVVTSKACPAELVRPKRTISVSNHGMNLHSIPDSLGRGSSE